MPLAGLAGLEIGLWFLTQSNPPFDNPPTPL